MSTPMQLGKCSSVHSPGVYPAFGPKLCFDNGGQIDGMTSGDGSLWKGTFGWS